MLKLTFSAKHYFALAWSLIPPTQQSQIARVDQIDVFGQTLFTILFACSDRPSEGVAHPPGKIIQNGDIIFQTSKSSQSQAIQLATKSKYSHMGIIYESEG